MMKQRHLHIVAVFVLVLCNIVPMAVQAQRVSEEQALHKAEQFFGKANQAQTGRKKAPRKSPKLALASNRDEFYVYNDQANGGYVIISGDERMPDVLGYSHTGHFNEETVPCNMRAWLEDYARQVVNLRTHPEVQASRRTATERKEISPMLKCHFDQEKYYNDKCPIIDGQHCPTGCVATAMAQVMYYYQWPKQTTDVIPGYTLKNYPDMPDVPVTSIDWDNMLPQYDYWNVTNYSQEQIDAISTLMLLCGTSVYMNYELGGSGAVTAFISEAFRNYFGYGDQIERVIGDYYTMDEWEQMIYEELNDGRPVLYGTAVGNVGHSTVIDGYKDGYFHINWGWNGSNDDYYLLTDLVNDEVIIGIQPANDDYASLYSVLDNGKMSLFYDKEKSRRSGTVISRRCDWANHAEDILNIVIDESFSKLKFREMNRLFEGLNKLQTIEGIENLNTSTVTSMNAMFYGCNSLRDLDVSGFNTEKVTDMNWMFGACHSLTSLDVSGFKTDCVQSMFSMFYGCSSLNSLDVSGFNTDKVTTMYGMFAGCSSLKNLDVSGFNTDNVTNMSTMFSGCSGLTNLDVSGFKTDNVNDMSWMFGGCSGLTSLDVSGFKTYNVTDLRSMFSDCSCLTNLDVSGFKTDNVTDMSYMFYCCSGLTSLDVSGFKTGNATNMSGMFYGCSCLTSLDLSGFKTDNVTNTSWMFGHCYNLKNLDVSGFKTDKVTDMSYMFYADQKLKTIYASEKWNMSNVETTDNMFEGCYNLTGGLGTTYDRNHTDGGYAHVDGGLGNPGYLTHKAPKYSITYMVDGKEYKTYDIEPGATITPEPAPEKEGYTFSGWSEIPETMPAHDITVTGTFEQQFNVGDVVKVLNFIMGEQATDADMELYDINGDGELNIGDVTLIVKFILDNGGTLNYGARRYEGMTNDLSRYTAVQFELKTGKATVKNIHLVENLAQSHQLMYQQVDAETYAVVVYSPTNELLRPDNNHIIAVETDGYAAKAMTIRNITAATPSGETANYQGLPEATGIQLMESNNSLAKVYDLNGRRQNGSKGQRNVIYIINGKKAVIK